MKRPFSLSLYAAVTGLLEPLATPILRARAKRGKEDPTRMGERLGGPSHYRPAWPLIWLHGASVGEGLSLLPLIERIRAERPDEVGVLVTTGTVTSAQMLAKRLPHGAIHQYAPLDTPQTAARFLDYWRPDVAVFVESEIWPNLIQAAHARRVKLVLISARMTEKSAKGWARAPKAAAYLLSCFKFVLPQDDHTARRLARFGVRDDGRLNVTLVGAPLPDDAKELTRLKKAAGKRPVLLAASTHPGEDEIVLDAFKAVADKALLVIVPRHPARGADIVELVKQRGFQAGLRSQGAAFGDAPVYVADTLGELGLWYRLARGALIGGSLLPGPGGHNPVEAAQLDCAILTGPYVDNWLSVFQPLVEAGAVSPVRSAGDLSAAFFALLQEPKMAEARARQAKALIGGEDQALDSVVRRLSLFFP